MTYNDACLWFRRKGRIDVLHDFTGTMRERWQRFDELALKTERGFWLYRQPVFGECAEGGTVQRVTVNVRRKWQPLDITQQSPNQIKYHQRRADKRGVTLDVYCCQYRLTKTTRIAFTQPCVFTVHALDRFYQRNEQGYQRDTFEYLPLEHFTPMLTDERYYSVVSLMVPYADGVFLGGIESQHLLKSQWVNDEHQQIPYWQSLTFRANTYVGKSQLNAYQRKCVTAIEAGRWDEYKRLVDEDKRIDWTRPITDVKLTDIEDVL